MTDSLLCIDVVAEIRKLTESRFRSPGEYAVELCRHYLSCHPGELRIDIGWRSMNIRADLPPFDGRVLTLLTSVFDESAPPGIRHDALLALEAAGMRALLAMFSLPAAVVRIDMERDGERVRAVFDRRRFRGVRPGHAADFGFSIVSMARQPLVERRLIRSALAHCPVPVSLHGRSLPMTGRISDCFYQVEIENRRMRGLVALPGSGDLVRVVRLRHGVVEQEVLRSARGGLVFHAVVEEDDDDLSATIETLTRSADALYRKAADRFFRFSPSQQERLRTLLFERVRRSGDESLLGGVPAFVCAGREPMTLEEIRRDSALGKLFAVDANLNLADRRHPTRTVLRLTSADHSFLSSLTGIHLRILPATARATGVEPGLWIWKLWRLFARMSLWGAAPVIAGMRCPEALQQALQQECFDPTSATRSSPVEVVISAARRPMAKWETTAEGTPRCVIASGHPRVRYLLDQVEKNPEMAIPVIWALFDGEVDCFRRMQRS